MQTTFLYTIDPRARKRCESVVAASDRLQGALAAQFGKCQAQACGVLG